MGKVNAHPCGKQYFQTKIELVPEIDVVRVINDFDTQTATVFFPWPFQLVGFAAVIDWTPSPLPVSELPIVNTWSLFQASDQAANVDWLQDMFQVMMYANRDVGDYIDSPFLGSIQYTEKLMGKFANYFEQYENKALQSFQWLTFLSPGVFIKEFWHTENALAQPLTLQGRFLELMYKIFQMSDRKLWGAPGQYTIYYGNPTIGGSRYLINSTCIVG